ncbi:WGR domain-containing protein (plasmid) [Candidatus Trichorickettsia mobilis]|jgi:predicted DNA-binding WGR domain protein|uniref:WGR domain-containing protein n=1 Tax=Candidatus Trichorickettsia mobilis TaxID=1346319 RepID=UPI002B263BCC|nr:WGR domain-containing protein [Candidatus Trichorickettsia mobilis]WPY01783.1 WGR domain-containing protein [Candidatus Trichorickettsia mobilis]
MQYRWLKNNKYYHIHLQLNLFGGTSVVCSWGSVNSKQGGYKIFFCSTQDEIDQILSYVTKRRKSRGYEYY